MISASELSSTPDREDYRIAQFPEILIEGLIRLVWSAIYRIARAQIPDSSRELIYRKDTTVLLRKRRGIRLKISALPERSPKIFMLELYYSYVNIMLSNGH